MNDTLSALLAPTRSMYGADAAAPTPAAQIQAMQAQTMQRAAQSTQLPAPAEDPFKPTPVSVMLGGLAIATGVAAGVNALVGSVAYPETKTRQFAAVGALSYAIPAGLLLGATILSRSQAK